MRNLTNIVFADVSHTSNTAIITDNFLFVNSYQQPETYVDFDSGTEFARAIDGKDAYAVWGIMDELLSVLQATNPRLFDGVMRKIEQI